MGIERFFAAINRNFNVVDDVENLESIVCDTFLIDFNSIIHTVSSKLISNLNKEIDKKYENKNAEDIEEMIIEELQIYVRDIIGLVKCNKIYISLDGVPTLPKILEQKRRRFIGDFMELLLSKYSLPFSFNKSLISPGTKFMNKVIDYLKKEDYPVETIISDVYEKGEGEFKILDYISKNKLDDIIIYSPDADLIILGMILMDDSKKIKILRYDQNTQVLNLIYINHLVDYLFDYKNDRINKIIDKKRYINDLCFIMTVFGNDFLPKLEDININMDLYLVLDGYLINYIDNDYILAENLEINSKSFYFFLSFLSKYESFLLKRNAGMYKNQNFNYANTVNMNLDLQNKKFNPNFIFYLDFGQTLDINNKYGKLEYYFFNDEKLIKLLDDTKFKNNVNKDYIEKNNRYQKLLKFEYDSKIKKHIIAMKDMNLREKELYLIEKKLDKYYVLFNPNNRFFDTLNKKDYYKNNNVRIMVSEYLKGFKWLINYYFKRKNVDEFWYYPFHISPLLSDLVNYFNHSLLSFNFMDKKLNINPLQALLYIAPIKISKINEFLESVDVNNTEKKKIKNFIESNLDLFYNLDEIYYTVLKGDLKKGLFDCSTATFISKCNYLILEDVKPINRFKIIL